MPVVSIAFDDIDSRIGGCTTHMTALFLLELRRLNATLIDYPILVRLNPSIPWKTRGNAATAIRVYYDGDPRDLWELAVWLVEEYAGARPWMQGKQPGLVMMQGETWRIAGLRSLYLKALTSVVPRDVVASLLERYNAVYRGGAGIIGAAAALAALAPWDDYTFELIAYRRHDTWHTKRCIRDVPPTGLPPCVFNNYTPGIGFTGAPGGGDPVLVGIRGDCPDMLWQYLSMIVCEDPEITVVYRSNQHTDPHRGVNPPVNIYSYGFFKAKIAGSPRLIPGGHVISSAVVNGKRVDLAFYRETGPIRNAALHLKPGDRVTVSGQVKPGIKSNPVIAVDKLVIGYVTPRSISLAPRCPRCGARMKSLGRAKGYRCPKCGYTDPGSPRINIVRYPSIMPGVYTPIEGRIPHLISPSYRKRHDGFNVGDTVPWSAVLTPR